MENGSDQILRILETHGSRLYALLVRLTLRNDVAEDLMQELFIDLSSSSAFRLAQNSVAYTFRTAIHLAFRWRKADAKNFQVGGPMDNEPSSTHCPVHDVIEREELSITLDHLALLPERDRELLIMHYLQQDSYERLADLFQKTPHQMRGLCHKAVVKLRTLINSDLKSHPQKEHQYE